MKTPAFLLQTTLHTDVNMGGEVDKDEALFS
jgi:hypothetical protein